MPNQQLIDYIKKEQQKGTEKSAIVSPLLTAGWQQSQIDEAFDFISPQPPLPEPQIPVANQISNTIDNSPQILSRKSGKNPFLIGTITILVLFFLAFFITALFAYGKLPIKNYDLQNKIGNFLMTIPFMPKTSRYVLESSAKAHLKITRFSFDTSIASDSNSLNTIFGTNNFDAQITGKIDYSNLKKPLSQLSAKITKELNFDFRTKEQIFYFRINKIPSTIALAISSFGITDSIQKQFFGKWFSIDMKPMDTDARAALEDDKDNKNTESTIQQGFKNYLDAFNSQNVAKSLTMKEEKVGSTNTYHLVFTPDDNILDTFWDKYTKKEKNKIKNTYSSNYKISDTIKNFVANIWIEKNTYLIQKSSVKFTIKSASSSVNMINPLGMFSAPKQEIPVSISMRLSDYGKSVIIGTPKGAVIFSEFIKNIMPQMGTYSPARQISQANNTKRASDINAILNSINQYAVDHNGAIPTGITAIPGQISTSGANICSALIPEYLAALPVDPKVNDGISITNCNKYYVTGYDISQNPTTKRITISTETINEELDQKISATITPSQIF